MLAFPFVRRMRKSLAVVPLKRYVFSSLLESTTPSYTVRNCPPPPDNWISNFASLLFSFHAIATLLGEALFPSAKVM